MTGFKKGIVAAAAICLLALTGTAIYAGGSSESKSEETYEMVVANVLTGSHTHSMALAHFAERCDELTDGRLELTVHNDGVLGAERVVMEQVQLGSTEFTRTSAAVLTGIVPEIAVFGLPYLFDSVSQMYEALDGDLGNYFKDKLEKEGLLVLGWFDYGARSVIAKEPVRSPDDLVGKRIRVQESPLDVKTFKAFGAAPVPLPWPDQYPALDSGVIDATENSPDTLYDGRFHEVVKYLSLTEHFIQPTVLYVSKIVFEKFPKDIQDAVRQAGKDAVAFVQEHQADRIEERLESLQDEGAIIVEDVNKDAFRAKAVSVYDEFLSEHAELQPFIDEIRK